MTSIIYGRRRSRLKSRPRIFTVAMCVCVCVCQIPVLISPCNGEHPHTRTHARIYYVSCEALNWNACFLCVGVQNTDGTRGVAPSCGIDKHFLFMCKWISRHRRPFRRRPATARACCCWWHTHKDKPARILPARNIHNCLSPSPRTSPYASCHQVAGVGSRSTGLQNVTSKCGNQPKWRARLHFMLTTARAAARTFRRSAAAANIVCAPAYFCPA